MGYLWDLLFGQGGISSELLYEYASIHGPKVVLVATLSAITIYRREMSCNHCYVESAPSKEDESSGVSRRLWDEEEAEELLDGAGHYCSGATLVPLILRLVRLLSHYLGIPSSTATALLRHESLTAEEVLDKAGCFCSGYPFLASLLHPPPPRAIFVPSPETEPTLFSAALPEDTHMQILAFLHPKDLVNVACVSRSCRRLIDEEDASSSRLWKNIFYRDYAWLVEFWDVGRAALKRAGVSMEAIPFTKDFYFRFSTSYMNYVLAGHNTYGRCLVGIGGHIYDLSLFLVSHPGSPETVMAHGGQDATTFFESMSHSLGARRIAQTLCVAADQSYLNRNACGVRPTREAALKDGDNDVSDLHSRIVVEPPATFNSQTEIRSKGTLQQVRDALCQEEADVRRIIATMNEPSSIGELNPYYDPIECKWKAWYTNRHLETVFIDNLTSE